jgi:hypothetical protein
MRLKTSGIWILIVASALLIVVAAILGIDILVEYVFAPLLEFVLRLFAGVGR